MNTLYLAPPIFFVIAFVFSMLGMGGSQLYIPILYWMGLDFKTEAVPLGMLLNVVNSSSAAFTYWRKKLIVWNVAIPFAITMIHLRPVGGVAQCTAARQATVGLLCFVYRSGSGPHAFRLEAQSGGNVPSGAGYLGIDRRRRLRHCRRDDRSWWWFVCGATSIYCWTGCQICCCNFRFCGHLFGGFELCLSPGNRGSPHLGVMDCNSIGSFSGQPIGLSSDGRQNETPRHQASLWLGVIGSSCIDHHQRCDPGMSVLPVKG